MDTFTCVANKFVKPDEHCQLGSETATAVANVVGPLERYSLSCAFRLTTRAASLCRLQSAGTWACQEGVMGGVDRPRNCSRPPAKAVGLFGKPPHYPGLPAIPRRYIPHPGPASANKRACRKGGAPTKIHSDSTALEAHRSLLRPASSPRILPSVTCARILQGRPCPCPPAHPGGPPRSGGGWCALSGPAPLASPRPFELGYSPCS